MTKMKFCGLRTLDDIDAVNKILPEYVGFVFVPKSKRYVTPTQVEKFRGVLDKKIIAVGVFVNEKISTVAELLNAGIIDAAQLHGDEDEDYIKNLREVTNKPLIKAFRINDFILNSSFLIPNSSFILLDAGAGGGKVFDWNLIKNFQGEYFLAGGLNPENVDAAIEMLHPFAVDVSSGIESGGKKDLKKMATFAEVVRRKNL